MDRGNYFNVTNASNFKITVIDLSGKNITILGLSRSGTSAAKLLLKKNANVFISEKCRSPQIQENLKKINLTNKIKFELGRHTKEFIKNKDFIVISPGIDGNAQPVIWAKQFNIPVISEIELASWFCQAKIIAITGTNGKTTVTTLIAKVLNEAGLKTYPLGNIGRPFSEDVLNTKPDEFVSLEVSSFQLEKIKNFKPYISIILNIAINHMDRHKNIEDYVNAKKKIFMNQDDNDWAILNAKDEYLNNLEAEVKPKIVYFNNDDEFAYNPNYSCVFKVAGILGVKQEITKKVLVEFKGLHHRVEEVRVLDGVKFINDSKSTNVTSTIWALNLIKEPIVLIAGGRDKGDDFAVLNIFNKKIKKIVLFGEAKEKIGKILDDYKISKIYASNLKEAVELANKLANSGDCVLLSPMCTSFDMFNSYEERGELFKGYVNSL